MSVFPLLVMGATHFSLPPLRAMFEVEPRLMVAWYGLAIALGFLVFRRTKVVKDHEYNRAKAMRSIRHVYQAEEQGLWETNAQLDGTMDSVTQSRMGADVGALAPESPELELNEDAKVEVTMLSEQQHIIKANERIKGLQSFDDEGVDRTVGAHRTVGPMDRFLDTVAGWFGVDSRARREAARIQRLEAASQATPVVAQRPVAPLRMGQREDETDVSMTTMSDGGGIDTIISTSGAVFEETPAFDEKTVPPVPTQSLESMAMMGANPSSNSDFAHAGPECRGCQARAGSDERFCPQCGLDL